MEFRKESSNKRKYVILMLIVVKTMNIKLWLIIRLETTEYLPVLKYRNKCLKHLEI